ncbi:hypothetical protein ACVNF4_03120 [Streptomyces sp. S6]
MTLSIALTTQMALRTSTSKERQDANSAQDSWNSGNQLRRALRRWA